MIKNRDVEGIICKEKDMEVLKRYLKKASRVQSVEEFEQWIQQERQ